MELALQETKEADKIINMTESISNLKLGFDNQWLEIKKLQTDVQDIKDKMNIQKVEELKQAKITDEIVVESSTHF